MSRHQWKAPSDAHSDHHSGPDSEQPGIFAATMRVVREQTEQTEQPTPPAPFVDDRQEPEDSSPLVWRPARSTVDPPPPPPSEEITVEIPRINDLESPAVPALALLSLGRHSMR